MKDLYITDLDGTFLNSKAELSDNSKKLISKAINLGACFSLATARTFATVTEMFKDIDLRCPLVLMNGVMLYNPSDKKIISYHCIENKNVKEVFELYKKHNVFPLVYRCKDNMLEIEYYNTDNPHQMKYVGKRTEVGGKKFVYSDAFSWEGKSEVIYIVTLDTYERLLPLYNDINRQEGITAVFYRDNYTECYFLEIFAGSTSKATAMSEVKKMTGADRAIAFGDNMNDIEMFKAADEAYAVENACDELKLIATDVIGKNDDDSVAEFILKHFGETQ